MKKAALLALLLSSCSDDEQLVHIEVSPHEVIGGYGPGYIVQYPIVILVETGGPVDGSIFGLEWKWGHRLQVEARYHHNPDPPADAGSAEYYVTRVLRDQLVPAGTPFRWHLEYCPEECENHFDFTSPTGGDLSGKAFTCSEDMCARLQTFLQGSDNLWVDFEFGEGEAAPVRVVGVSREP